MEFMKLQIAWRNPSPPLRKAVRLEAVVQDDSAALYVLRGEAKELSFDQRWRSCLLIHTQDEER